MAESTFKRLGGATGIAALIVAIFGTACILPARIASGVKGTVIDAVSGVPLEGAIVVVRFDGRYGDVLPDRELLGHREVTSNANGNFDVGAVIRPGLSTWPVYKTDARIVAVMMPGYRCAKPRSVPPGDELDIALEPALDLADQRESCRPVPARRGEADAYMAAWRNLFPGEKTASDLETERQLSRVLEARSPLGFGENCEGPVTDLALAADGTFAGFSVTAKPSEIRVLDLRDGTPGLAEFVAHDAASPPRRLAWTSAGDLVLWEPAGDARRSVSSSVFGSDHFEVVYRSAQQIVRPAKFDFGAKQILKSSRPQHTPLDPADLNDEADTRWNGRSFSLQRSLDPLTGLASESLRIARQNGTHYEIALPGEACGPNGRFGRPHYRITQNGRSGIDLRFVDGGCHAIEIDFESGDWAKVDGGGGGAVCAHVRNIPASHLTTGLRSYTREVEAIRVGAGGDRSASYAILISPGGSTHVETRSLSGEAVSVAIPKFPIATPLRRINISLIGGVGRPSQGSTAIPPTPDLNPL